MITTFFQNMQERQWFRFLYIAIILLVAAYVTVHLVFNKNSYEFSQIIPAQSQQINRIYFDSDVTKNTTTNETPVKQDKNGNKVDSAAGKKVPIKPALSTVDIKKDSCKCLDTLNPCKHSKCERVIAYLNNEFNYKLDPKQIDSLKKYLCCCSNVEATNFLTNYNFKVQSFFWLTDSSGCYVEVIFWSLFGVLCSLIFAMGVVIKSSTTDTANPKSTFDASEIPHSLAKLIYAPICTLVIVLGYNLFKAQNLVEINSGKGLLVFSFIAGFNSSRLIAFLDRLRDLLLPNSGTSELPTNKPSTNPDTHPLQVKDEGQLNDNNKLQG